MFRRGTKTTAVRLLAVVTVVAGMVIGTGTGAYAADPVGNLDSVKRAPGVVTLRGWAVDPDKPTDPSAVAIFADGALVGYTAAASLNRPDVAAAFPTYGANHGFQLSVTLTAGSHNVCAVGLNTAGTTGTDVFLGCRAIETGLPFGRVDTVDGLKQFHAKGWAIDPDTADPIPVAAYVDGALVAFAPAANISRPDVADAFPGFGDAHGFDLTFTTTAGYHFMCVIAINASGTGGSDVPLGCAVTNVPALFGNFEDVFISQGGLGVRGWAADSDTPGAGVPILVYDNGAVVAYTNGAYDSRPDVGAAYPWFGPNHGFSLTWAAQPGTHVICVLAFNIQGTNGSARALDCGTYVY